MKKPFGYIYKITNLINGKIYIGKHESSFINSVYFGSGIALKNSIKKHGRENFKKEVLEVCYSRKQINKQEIFWIKFYNSRNAKIGYNQTEGGTGGSTNKGKKFSKKWSEGISKARLKQGATENHIKAKNTPEYLEKQSKISKGIWDRPGFRERKIQLQIEPVIVTNINTGKEVEYSCKKEVREKLKIQHFAHYIRSGKIYRRYGLKFRYKNITYAKS